MFLMIVDLSRDPSGYQESLPDQLKRIRFAQKRVVWYMLCYWFHLFFEDSWIVINFPLVVFLTYSRIQFYLFTWCYHVVWCFFFNLFFHLWLCLSIMKVKLCTPTPKFPPNIVWLRFFGPSKMRFLVLWPWKMGKMGKPISEPYSSCSRVALRLQAKISGLARANPMTWGWDWDHQTYEWFREGYGSLG